MACVSRPGEDRGGGRRQRELLLLLTLAGVLLTTAPGTALAAWSDPPGNLSAAGGGADSPSVSIGGGLTAVAWRRDDDTAASCCRIAQARIRPPGGHFGQTRNLSAPGQNVLGVDVAVGTDGTVVAVWTRLDGTQPPFTCCYRVQARVRPPGGPWGPAQTLSVAGLNASDVDVGVARNGRAVVTWTRETATLQRLLQARFRPAGSGGSPNFGPVQTLTPGENAYSMHLVVAPNGRAIVVFQRFDGSTNRISTKVRSPGHGFGALRNVSAAGDDADYPGISMAPDGAALVGWVIPAASPNYKQQARFLPPGGQFGPISFVSSKQDSGGDPGLAIDAHHRQTVALKQNVAPDPRVLVRSRPAGGPFGASQFLSPIGEPAGDPVLATGPNRATFAAWTRFDGTSGICCSRAQARIRRPGGASFLMQDTLSIGGSNADSLGLAAGPGTTAVAVWQRFDGADNRIQFSRYHP